MLRILTVLTVGVLYALPAQAVEVEKVQLGIAVAKSGACPRTAQFKMWAHTKGPGKVKFVVHGRSGSKTGQFIATAVKGSAGNYLATRSRNVTIAADTKTAYRLEVIGAKPKFSKWVRLVAECGPKPRTNTKTTKSGAKPKAKKASDVGKPQPRTNTKTTKSGAKPNAKKASKNTGKPATKPASGGKKTKNTKSTGCKPRLSVTRHGAYTKKGGIATARIAWRNLVQAKYGFEWRHLINAKGKSETCKRKKLLLYCTVSAKPCKG